MTIHRGSTLCLLGIGLFLLYGCIPDQNICSQEGVSIEEKYLEKGLAYYKDGNLDAAILLFAEYLKVNPHDQKARKLFEEALKMKDGEGREAKKIPLELENKTQTGLTVSNHTPEVEKIPVTEGTQTSSAKTEAIDRKITPIQVDANKLEPLIAKQKGSVEKIKKELSTNRKEELKEPELSEPSPVESKVESQKIIDSQQANNFSFAKDMYSKGLFNAAATEFKTLLDKYPNTILKEKILYLLANALIKAKKYPEAIDTAKKLMDINGEFKNDGTFLLAQAYDESGNLKQAQAEYLKAAMSEKPVDTKVVAPNVRTFLDKTSPYPTAVDELIMKAHLSAGDAYKKDGEYERSLFEYNRVINDHPKSAFAAEAYFRIGEVYQKAYRVRDFQKAYDTYQKIVKHYPNSPWSKKAKKQADYLWENYLK